MLQFEATFIKLKVVRLKSSGYADSVISFTIVIRPNSVIIISTSLLIKTLNPGPSSPHTLPWMLPWAIWTESLSQCSEYCASIRRGTSRKGVFVTPKELSHRNFLIPVY